MVVYAVRKAVKFILTPTSVVALITIIVVGYDIAALLLLLVMLLLLV